MRNLMSSLFAAAALFTVATPAAHALPGNEITVDYYDDANFSNWVGEETTVYCGGGRGHLDGKRSRYKIVFSDACENTHHVAWCYDCEPSTSGGVSCEPLVCPAWVW